MEYGEFVIVGVWVCVQKRQMFLSRGKTQMEKGVNQWGEATLPGKIWGKA